jgi:hypothetical protein
MSSPQMTEMFGLSTGMRPLLHQPPGQLYTRAVINASIVRGGGGALTRTAQKLFNHTSPTDHIARFRAVMALCSHSGAPLHRV